MVPHTTDAEPIPDLAGAPVYTTDGFRLGTAVGVGVDLEDERAAAIYVTDVETTAFDGIETGPRGVRIPYRYVRGVRDAVVLRVSLPRANDAGAGDAAGAGEEPEAAEAVDAPAEREATADVCADGDGTAGATDAQ